MHAGLVETSNNVASVHVRPRDAAATSPSGSVTFTVLCMTRSSLLPALEAVRETIEACAARAGGTVAKNKAYPGWQPDADSALLKVRPPRVVCWRVLMVLKSHVTPFLIAAA